MEDMQMADRRSYPDSNVDTGVAPGREYPGAPRWVKVFGIIALVLVLLFGGRQIAGRFGMGGMGMGGMHAAPSSPASRP